MLLNNSLIKKEESFFKKVLSKLKKIFRIKHNNKNMNFQLELQKDDNTIIINKQEEKTKFFEMYNSLKSGNIDIQTLSYNELKKFNIIIEEENKLKLEKLNNLREENNMLLLDINTQEQEKKRLKEMIKKQS